MASRIKMTLVCAIAWAAILLPAVHAAEAKKFRLGQEGLESLLGEQVFSSWNGGDPDKVLKPGVKVLFFGEAQGCPIASRATRGGPVRDSAEAIAPEQLLELTGLHAGPSGKRRTWRPSGDTPICEPQARGRVGQSFVEVNANDAAGGIALYTQTGPEKDGRPGFFGPFGSKGQGRVPGRGVAPCSDGGLVRLGLR